MDSSRTENGFPYTYMTLQSAQLLVNTCLKSLHSFFCRRELKKGQVISFIFSLFSGYKDERPPDSEDKGGVRPDSGDKNAQQSSIPVEDKQIVIDIPNVSDETTQQQKTEETVIPTPPAAPATEDGHITIQVEDGVPADDSSLVQVIKERSKDPRVKGKFPIQVNDESAQIIPKPINSHPPTVKWIKHYCNTHKILIVGDGDFSFSACLAKAFGSAQNMVATSLDSIGFLRENYGMSPFNIAHLKNGGGVVIHEFDATKMSSHQSVKGIKFDRIIYNFPLAGFFKGESKEYQLNRNKMLVKLFFKNASKMIADDGQIHISHKCNGFFLDWDLEKLAQKAGLLLLESVVFNLCDYPGYNTKYGFGGDNNFYCNPSRTYKFRLEQKAL